MDILFCFVGLNVHFFFLFKREFLFSKTGFVKITACNTCLFVVALILLSQGVGNANLIKLLTCPFVACIVFYCLKSVFYLLYKRNAVDTFWSMDISLFKDGIFNAVFWGS